MINKDIEKLLNEAFAEANQARFEFFTTEHMLLALCQKNNEVREALVYLSADISQIISNLQHYLDKNIPRIANNAETTIPTAAFHRIIERTNEQRNSAGKEMANGLHMLIALMQESESHAVYYLKKQGVKKLALMEYVSRTQPDNPADHDTEEDSDEKDPLKKYCTDLNALAEQGRIDPLIGREHEIERTIQILSRRRKNNPILVGEAGVGKTAIAEGLAKKIVDGEVPAILQGTVIYSVDLGSMVAGSKYRGDFEKRIKSLINRLTAMDHVIIFIDEIHTLLGAGSTSDSTLDASNLLKPALSAGTLRCIGATTYKEYKGSFEKNAALARRFQKVDINEPSKDETIDIIRGLLPQFEHFHKVKYGKHTVEAAVDLADKYIHDRHLPDKAIDLIDEAGSSVKIKTPPKKTVSQKDIETVLAKIARIPEKTVTVDDKRILKTLESRLHKKVFGQDDAITALASAIKLSRAGLKDLEKPIGSFLFTGPTGVGKTEVSKQLAEELNISFIRFDMSEYMESHTVSRLIGSPPGYVGHEQGGLLTDAIANTPHCVLLLDEIEKAHPDIFNLLLQIMDYGKLTDSNGKTVIFSNTILIMTSNVGASVLDKNPMGFGDISKSDFDNTPAIKRVFTPEFRNRLTDIIQFAPLEKPVIIKIIDKMIALLNEQLAQQNIHIRLNKSAKNYLLRQGYNKLMGARPMARVIDKHIKKPLSEKILFGDLRKGGDVTISYHAKSDKLILTTKGKMLANS
ncbi:MAG: ATP-dependent Clp protease ATP-binding subunit ClpA [Gammaproteobacteria bacterium]|nr:MAG: ATP-dependent Clp protease ATP-binding subunit ClpA [Gammaproteobacteria bacterium]